MGFGSSNEGRGDSGISEWLAAFPNHSSVAQAKARLAELRK